MSENDEVSAILEKLSCEIKATISCMFETLSAFNVRIERIEKWIQKERHLNP